jgi:streptogramin lyase
MSVSVIPAVHSPRSSPGRKLSEQVAQPRGYVSLDNAGTVIDGNSGSERRAMLRHIRVADNRGLMILLMVLIIASSHLTSEAQNSSTITGIIKSASGEPVAGAFVKVRGSDSGLAYMVVSQTQGRYSTPNLLPGKYTVQALGGDRQSDSAAPVEVTSGQQAKMDLVLSAPRKMSPPRKKITEADYEKLMPEGDGKKLLTSRCLLCHGMETVVPIRATPDEWEKTVDLMGVYLQDYRINLSAEEKNGILDYVAKNFGPDTPPFQEGSAPDPNINLPATLVKGTEAKYVAMEFTLARHAGPHDIAVDSQGIAWVSERGSASIGRFDPKSFTYTLTPTPPAKHPQAALNAIAVDSRDMVWTIDNSANNRLYQYNTKSREFNSYDIPAAPNVRSAMNTIRFFPDGSVWGSGIASSRILKLDPKTRKVAEYPVPKGSHPYGMAIGGDKMIWYAAEYGNEIVRLDPSTGKLTRYKVPTPKSDLRRMAADVDGNLWAGAHEAGNLVKVDYRTGKVTEYPTPTEYSGPYSIDVDTNSKRNLIWFSERYADKIGRFDPRTNSFVEFPLPSPDSDPRRIEIDRSHPNRVWWSGMGSDRIGYIELIE